MTTVSVTALIVVNGAAKFLKRGLELAKLAGLDVDSWRVGDPTLSDYTFISDVLGTLEEVVVSNAKSAFLSTAEPEWKPVHAKENFGVDVPEATYAQPSITLRNNGVNYYPFAAGDLTVKASAINKTYRNTGPGYDPDTLAPADLNPGALVRFDLIADEAGADSSVGVDEVDALVTVLDDDIEIVGSTAGGAADAPSGEEIERLCEDSVGALSPMGPPEAYAFVARTPKYTGTTEVTRSAASLESATGNITITVASPSGVVTPSSLALVQTAIEKWANPICGIPTAQSAVVRLISVTASLTGDIPADYAARVRGAIATKLKSIPLGGIVSRSMLFDEMHKAVPGLVAAAMSVPAADIQLASNEVPAIGTTVITES